MTLDLTAWLTAAALVALAVDRWLGEPPTWCHPVVAMGHGLGRPAPWLLSLSPRPALWAGGVLWLLGASLLVALAAGLQQGLLQLTAPWAAAVLAGLLLKPLLAWRLLRDEVAAVEQALCQSLPQGRAQLARLVSRDVSQLDASAVREAAIETLAENLNDSVVAPLCWFLVGGLPGAVLYRWANTADAMWGYRGRWEWAGKVAARADDLLSWLPARATALLLCLAAGRWPGWRTLRQEAARTPSPNGGWPMGAMARLLGCRLGKPGAYLLHPEGSPPGPAEVAQALRGSGRAVGLLAVLLVVVLGLALLASRWPGGARTGAVA